MIKKYFSERKNFRKVSYKLAKSQSNIEKLVDENNALIDKTNDLIDKTVDQEKEIHDLKEHWAVNFTAE